MLNKPQWEKTFKLILLVYFEPVHLLCSYQLLTNNHNQVQEEQEELRRVSGFVFDEVIKSSREDDELFPSWTSLRLEKLLRW